MNAETIQGTIFGTLAAAIWGGMYVVSDVILEIIPPFSLLSLRLVLGAITLGIVIAYKRPELPDKNALIAILGIGFVGYGLSLGAQFIGTDLSTAVNGAIVTSATPAFVIIFAVWLLREKLTFRRLFAVVLATCGVVIIIDFTQASFRSDTFIGNVFLCGAALTWGLYSVLVRWVSRKYPHLDTLIVTAFAFISGMVFVIPASLIELNNTTIHLADINSNVILGILFLGVISTAVAMWLWNRAFVLLDASAASLLFFVQPISGAFLGWFFLDQSLTTATWIGGFLIAIGVLLSISPKDKTNYQ